LPEPAGVIGFEHAGISVADLEAMSKWYATALGLEVEGSFEIPQIDLCGTVLGGNGYRVELIHQEGSKQDPHRDPDPGRSLRWRGLGHICLRVERIEETFEALVAAGATALFTPRPSPLSGRRFAYVNDPEGNQIELMEYE
jgi:catechol 2,3-dioxygenase-like lactoylglutathione lyase family enzyme